jgi:ERCC4-type nuclease
MITSLLIDSREPPVIVNLAWGDPSPIVVPLPAGDLWLTKDRTLLCIERKTPNDLLASIADGRLFQQAAQLVQQTPHAYLIITGALLTNSQGYINDTGWTLASVQGAFNRVESLGVRVVQCLGEEAYKATVFGLADVESEVRLPPLSKPRSVSEAAHILASFPGVGYEKAESILAAFENHLGRALAWLTWVNYDEIKVAGIGPVTKQKARAVLGLNGAHIFDRELEELYVFTQDSERHHHYQRTNIIAAALEKGII